MGNATLKTEGTILTTGDKLSFTINLVVFQEEKDGLYFAYSPAFDMSAYGKSYNEAISEFYATFQIHIEWMVENGTLFEDLEAHGWSVDRSSYNVRYAPLSSQKRREEKNLLRVYDRSYMFTKAPIPVTIPI